jgi:hypothetical protein
MKRGRYKYVSEALLADCAHTHGRTKQLWEALADGYEDDGATCYRDDARVMWLTDVDVRTGIAYTTAVGNEGLRISELSPWRGQNGR